MARVSSTDFALYARLLRQARPYWPHIGLFLLVSLLASPLALLTPLPLKIIVDSVLGSDPIPGAFERALPAAITGSDTSVLLFAAILFVAIAVLRQLQELTRTLVHTYTGEQLVLAFRARLFSHVQRLSLSYHDAKGTADSTYRIQYDAPAVQSIAIDGLVPFITAGLTLSGMLVIIMRLDWQLGIVALAVSPVLLLLTGAYRQRLRQRARQVKRLESSAMSVVQEVLASLRVVKAFSQEEREQERFLHRSTEGMRTRIRLALAEGAFAVFVGGCVALGTAAVLYIGARHVQSGALTLGELLLVTGYLSQLYEPLKTVSTRVARLQSSLASAERAFALLDEAPDVEERPNARRLTRASGAITFQNVRFGYEPDHPVLEGVSFQIPAGGRAGIIGATGAGKTTLVSLLARFYDVTGGAILLDGVDLRQYRLTDLRDQFSIVLQEPVLFSTTIAENIAYARPDASFDEIVAAARAASADGFITALPEGYETLVGERGMRLSGGERQRIALARAFLKDAPILILDEPTSSVDLETEASIMEALLRLMAGRTTLVIAHRVTTLAHCDLWLELASGGLRNVLSPGAPSVRDAEASDAHGVDATNSAQASLAELKGRTQSLRRRLGALQDGGEDQRGAAPRQRSQQRTRQKPVTPVLSGLAIPPHPATNAWLRVSGDGRMPERIECLKETNKSMVYRLKGAGPDGADVVAKRRRRDALQAERVIYEAVLPQLPVPSPVYYGLAEEIESDHGWLFLEDAGDTAYSPHNVQHRALAARWLAGMHTSAEAVAVQAGLPDRGLDHYLQHLRSACGQMRQARANPALLPEDFAVLDDLLAQCVEVESRWEKVERLCRGMPPTLVHGDFVPKNVRVRAVEGGSVLLPFDWGTAGWGVPAADLADVDPALYWCFASSRWRSLDLPTVTRLAKVGRLCRSLAAIHWASRWLDFEWIEKPIGDLALYQGWLADARQQLEGER